MPFSFQPRRAKIKTQSEIPLYVTVVVTATGRSGRSLCGHHLSVVSRKIDLVSYRLGKNRFVYSAVAHQVIKFSQSRRDVNIRSRTV